MSLWYLQYSTLDFDIHNNKVQHEQCMTGSGICFMTGTDDQPPGACYMTARRSTTCGSEAAGQCPKMQESLNTSTCRKGASCSKRQPALAAGQNRCYYTVIGITDAKCVSTTVFTSLEHIISQYQADWLIIILRWGQWQCPCMRFAS